MQQSTWTWSVTPMVRWLIPFLVGIGCAISFDGAAILGIKILFFISFLVAFVGNWFQKTTIFGISMALATFSLGYWRTAAHDERQSPQHFAQFLDSTRTKYEKSVFSVRIADADERARTYRLRARVTSVRRDDSTFQPTDGEIWLYWRKPDSTDAPPQYAPPSVGDELVVAARVAPIEPPKNPLAFDFRQHSHFKNIHFQAFVAADEVVVVANRRAPYLFQLAADWKAHFLAILKTNLPTENEYAVGAALFLGENTLGGDTVRNAYVETGAIHILAVSGMHVGLLYLGLSLFFRRFRWFRTKTGRWVETMILLGVVGFFAILTGLGGSVLRASVMFGLMAIGKAWQRRRNMWNILAGSLAILLLFDPFLIADVGLQLSFMAVVGIVFFYERIYKRLFFEHRVLDYAWQTTAMGLAAQLTVTPISLYYFHQFPAFFWLSGLLLVPISTVGMYLGIVLFAVQSLKIGFLTNFLGKILFGLLTLMNFIIFQIQKIPPPSMLTQVWLSWWHGLFFYLFIFFICYGIWRRRLVYASVGVAILLVAVVDMKIKAYNLGQKKQIIFYDFGKKTLFELFFEKKCITFSNDFSDSKKIKLTNYEMYNYLKIQDKIAISMDSSVEMRNFWSQPPFFIFHGKTGAAIAQLPQNAVTLPINTVLVYGNPRFSMHELSQTLKADRYIFDASNARWKIEKWKSECRDLGISFHDIGESGAFVWTF